jgi:hypothetical protein
MNEQEYTARVISFKTANRCETYAGWIGKTMARRSWTACWSSTVEFIHFSESTTVSQKIQLTVTNVITVHRLKTLMCERLWLSLKWRDKRCENAWTPSYECSDVGQRLNHAQPC